LTIIDDIGVEQVIESTDSHPFWVVTVTDDPDFERAARSVVGANGVWLYHANIGPTENGCRPWVWKKMMQEFADETGLTITVRHDPRGSSKWNPIEYRLFAMIS